MQKRLATEGRSRRRLTLALYIRRRNGVPVGSRGSLRNMLRRSLGAATLADFWRYWNPVFGYYLGTYIFSPLRRVLPRALALVLTFVACGVLHDAVTIAIRGSVTFLFTPWFFLMGLGVVVGQRIGWDLSDRPWALRAGVNLTYVLACLGTTLVARRIFGVP